MPLLTSYLYIYNIHGYTTNTIYYYLLLCPSLSPQGPLTKRALARKLFSKLTQKPPIPVMCIPPSPLDQSLLFSPRFYSINRWFSRLFYDDDDHNDYTPLQRARYFSFSPFSFPSLTQLLLYF